MIPTLRKQFNSSFTPEKYRMFLRRVDEGCGTHVQFRLSETPCFLPQGLLDTMLCAGQELIRQLVTPEYRANSENAVPAEFNCPNEPAHPMFVQVDFGLVRNSEGELEPKLVELQGFPSVYGYQALLAQAYMDVYELQHLSYDSSLSERPSPSGRLAYFLSALDQSSYSELLRRAIVAEHDPSNVVLLEIHPKTQKTLPDFLVTEKMLGIRIADVVEVKKEGSRLYYERSGIRVPIHRIYNRVIADELQRKGLQLGFDWRDQLDVEWAGHPNWYFRMSKFSIPFLVHASVPKTWFLHHLEELPADLENYALKPLYSFAGRGVVIAPKREEIAAISPDQRCYYILQERMHFEPVIETPFGRTRAEVRVMYIWLNELTPVLSVIRMGRGLMMGVDHNQNMEWVGASAGLYLEQ